MDLQQAWDDAAKAHPHSFTENEVLMALQTKSTDQLRTVRRRLAGMLRGNYFLIPLLLLGSLGPAQFPPSPVGWCGLSLLAGLLIAALFANARLQRRLRVQPLPNQPSASYLSEMVREYREILATANGLRAWRYILPAALVFVLASSMAKAPTDATFGSWWAGFGEGGHLPGLWLLPFLLIALAITGGVAYLRFYRPMNRVEDTIRELRDLQTAH